MHTCTAYLFNCAQRAHANFTENHPSATAAMLIAGLRYPLPAAIMGAGWTLSRALYLAGYVRPAWGEAGTGRYKGVMFWLFQAGLIGLAAATGLQMVKSTW
jgi:glutathione S-transferase